MFSRIKVECAGLAVAASNALAFLPANSTVKVARMRLRGPLIDFMATDTYAAGNGWTRANSISGDEAFELLMSRDALTDLERTARMGKKVEGELSVTDTGFTFLVLDGASEPIRHEAIVNAEASEMFDVIDGMLMPEQEFRTAFQPMLLQRFSKVKADKDQRVADVAIDDPDSPVLIKIGTEFRGLVMPVSRSVHAELIGEEGLW